jgi:uncharacterized protein
MNVDKSRCVAFIGNQLVAQGGMLEVALELKQLLDAADLPSYLVFDEDTGRQIDLDLRGSREDVVARLSPAPEEVRSALAESGGTDSEQADRSESDASSPRKGVGRPKLGVVAREVTLLPRHWDWLNEQPGGASVALRKLVEEAKKTHGDRDRVRRAQEAAYRFMSAKAGNFEGFEEATRALFRADSQLFLQLTEAWPADVRYFTRKLAGITEDTAV